MLLFMAYAADEPEGSASKGSQYLSGRELKVILLILAVIFVSLIPIYQQVMKQRNFVVCIDNMKSISDSTRLYSVDNEEKLPPCYFADNENNPILVNGLPITWATIIQDKMKSVGQFKCPSAQSVELAKSLPFSGKDPINSSYGMYSAMNMQFVSLLRNPDSTVLFAETSNAGALGTLNPVPFKNLAGENMLNDGFLLGFDSGNYSDALTLRKAQFTTRLAFKKDLSSATPIELGRHMDKKGNQMINVIYAGGGAGQLYPGDNKVTRRTKDDDDLTGIWTNR